MNSPSVPEGAGSVAGAPGLPDGFAGTFTSRHAYQVCGQPWISSSGGPPPPLTTCWRSPPVSMYRLVNVPANPSGRRECAP